MASIAGLNILFPQDFPILAALKGGHVLFEVIMPQKLKDCNQNR